MDRERAELERKLRSDREDQSTWIKLTRLKRATVEPDEVRCKLCKDDGYCSVCDGHGWFEYFESEEDYYYTEGCEECSGTGFCHCVEGNQLYEQSKVIP